MTLQLTYSDRMGTTNHDMECISPFSSEHFQVVDKFISFEMFYKAATLFRFLLMHAGRVKSHACPCAFGKASNKTTADTNTRSLHSVFRLKIIIFFCFCRLCTRARRRAGRSTARHRTQMGSASAPWSHQPRTCVTATHAAGSSASSWRR